MKNKSLLVGFICLCAAIILAFFAQYLLTPLGKVIEGYLTYGVASLFALIGVIKIDKYVPLPEQTSSDKTAQKKPLRAFIIFGSILIIIGIAASVISFYFQDVKQLYRPAFWWWIFALLITATGGWALDYRPRKSNFKEFIKKNKHEIILLSLLVFGAALLRIPNLYDIPPHIEGDETGAAVAARQILTGEEKNLFSEGFWNDLCKKN